jgi:hypothetical protein
VHAALDRPGWQSIASSPAVAGGVVYVGSVGKLYAYAVGCASSGNTCTPLWTGDTGGWVYSSPAVADGVVYVGSNGTNKLFAFAVGCGSGNATCSPLWTGAVGGANGQSSPTVANGVVYVQTSNLALYAYAVGCASGGDACTALWTASIGTWTGGGTTGWLYSSPSVVDGVVYVGAEDSKLHAFNVPAATHLTVATTTPWVAGVAHGVTVTAKDAYGNTATGYTGTIRFTSTDPAATLPADYTFTAADAGTHVFSANVTLKTAGSQSVTATDTVTASIHGSQTGIVVTPAALSKLAVSGLTTPRTAGSTGSIRVTATDAYGNRSTGYLGTVHFTSTDRQAAKLPANYSFTVADAGTHVFSANVILKTAGTQSVTATDTVTASLHGSQSGIVVTAAALQARGLGYDDATDSRDCRFHPSHGD